VPPYWYCDADWLGDTYCDCGCGDLDTDCADGGLGTCDYNDCASGSPVDGQNWLCQGTSPCAPNRTMTCGGTHTYNNSSAGSTDVINYPYGCAAWYEGGPEYTYTFTAPAAGSVTATLSGMSVDLDVFVLSAASGVCDPFACISAGETSATFTAAAGETYYIVVDGYNDATGAYTLKVTCP